MLTAPEPSTPVPDKDTGNLREFLRNVLKINRWMLEAQHFPLKVPHPRKLCLDFLPHIRIPLVHIHSSATLSQPPPVKTHTAPQHRRCNTGTATTGDVHTNSNTPSFAGRAYLLGRDPACLSYRLSGFLPLQLDERYLRRPLPPHRNVSFRGRQSVYHTGNSD
jgi:hypothetical protein